MRHRLVDLIVCLACAACGEAHTKPPVPASEAELPVRSERDTDCDGTIDQCTSYQQEGGETRIGTDTDCDDVPEADCQVEVKAADGTIETAYLDDDCDGTPDRECFSLRNERGHFVSSVEESCDGVRTQCIETMIDARGRNTSFVRDNDCDGTAETCLRHTYDADGTQHFARDSDCDGTADTTDCQITLRDAEGQPTFNALDADCDGTADGFCTDTTYGYGLQLTEIRDTECDGAPDLCTASSTSDDGRTVRTGRDSNCDGLIDGWCTIVTLDDQDRRISERSEGDCAGLTQPARCWLIAYDAQGRYAGRSLDMGCTGAPDWCDTSVYADTL